MRPSNTKILRILALARRNLISKCEIQHQQNQNVKLPHLNSQNVHLLYSFWYRIPAYLLNFPSMSAHAVTACTTMIRHINTILPANTTPACPISASVHT